MNHDLPPTWVVVCGLIRDPDELRSKIDLLSSWRAEGIIQGIVLSTWIGEIDRYDLRAHLHENEVFTIERPQPPISLDSHIFHQMLSLYHGLELCPDNAHVLKIRVDKCDIGDEIKRRLTLPLQSSSPLPGWPRVFESRIVLHSGLLTHPLFLCDILFFGRKQDLLKLISFDIEAALFGFRIYAEQILHHNVWRDILPIFSHYFRVNVQFLHRSSELTPRLHAESIRHPFAQEVLASYYLLMSQYYEIGFSPLDRALREQYQSEICSLSAEQLFSLDEPSAAPMLTPHPGNGTPWFTSDYWIQPFLDGRLRSDPLGDAFQSAIERARRLEWHSTIPISRFHLVEGARALAASYRRSVPELVDYSLEEFLPHSEFDWTLSRLRSQLQILSTDRPQ